MSWQTTVCSHPVQYIDRSCVYSTRVNSHVSRAQHHTSHKLGSSFGAHRVPSLCPASGSAIGIALYVGFIAPHCRPLLMSARRTSRRAQWRSRLVAKWRCACFRT